MTNKLRFDQRRKSMAVSEHTTLTAPSILAARKKAMKIENTYRTEPSETMKLNMGLMNRLMEEALAEKIGQKRYIQDVCQVRNQTI